MVFGLFKRKPMECAPYQQHHSHPEKPEAVKWLLEAGVGDFIETGVRSSLYFHLAWTIAILTFVHSLAAGRPRQYFRCAVAANHLLYRGPERGHLYSEPDLGLRLCATARRRVSLFVLAAHVYPLFRHSDKGVFMLAGHGEKPKLMTIKMNVGSTIMLALK